MKFTGLIRKLAIGLALALAPAASFAGVFISVGFAPPALPVYAQPICPGDGYLWNPGYWAYGDDGYYWVPGVWVQPPTVGLLWTPGYWGFNNGVYVFNAGYWGPHVGFYGGINYGFGFGGVGFYGGEWRGGHFAYNTAYSRVDTTVIHNTYVNRTVINNTTYNHTSFNGGSGGIQARPTAQEQNFAHENHIPPTHEQESHIQAARAIPTNYAKANGGHPAMAAIQRPGAMNTAVPARGVAPSAARPAANNARPAAAANQRPNNVVPRGGNSAAPVTRATSPQARTQAQPREQAAPRAQAAPREQAAPRHQAAPRAQPAPRAQAAPRAEEHAEPRGH